MQNERWSLDRVSDTLSNGRTFRGQRVVDKFSREALALEGAHEIPFAQVIEVLEQFRAQLGLPAVIIPDNRRRVYQPSFGFHPIVPMECFEACAHRRIGRLGCPFSGKWLDHKGSAPPPGV